VDRDDDGRHPLVVERVRRVGPAAHVLAAEQRRLLVGESD
jgi:hypothetical protein